MSDNPENIANAVNAVNAVNDVNAANATNATNVANVNGYLFERLREMTLNIPLDNSTEYNSIGQDDIGLRNIIFPNRLPGYSLPGLMPGPMPGLMPGLMPGSMPGLMPGLMPNIDLSDLVPDLIPGLGLPVDMSDILLRSMEDTGDSSKPTDKDVIKDLPIVEIFNDTTQCAICQDTIASGSTAIKLPCPDAPHYFCSGDDHENCEGIKPWLKDHNTCPICRFELPEEKIETNTESQEQIPQPPTPRPRPLPINDLRTFVNSIINDEMSNFDDDGFDTREFEEAIHRSLDT